MYVMSVRCPCYLHTHKCTTLLLGINNDYNNIPFKYMQKRARSIYFESSRLRTLLSLNHMSGGLIRSGSLFEAVSL